MTACQPRSDILSKKMSEDERNGRREGVDGRKVTGDIDVSRREYSVGHASRQASLNTGVAGGM